MSSCTRYRCTRWISSCLFLLVMVNIFLIGTSFDYSASSISRRYSGELRSRHNYSPRMSPTMKLSPLKDPYEKLGKGVKTMFQPLVTILTQNPISRIVTNTYSFFWALPRRNLQYDSPFILFKNSSADWIQYYQFPHNLPPYTYLNDFDYPEDFFCYGLPGCTLPLGEYTIRDKYKRTYAV